MTIILYFVFFVVVATFYYVVSKFGIIYWLAGCLGFWALLAVFGRAPKITHEELEFSTTSERDDPVEYHRSGMSRVSKRKN